MTTIQGIHAFQTDRLYTESGQRIAWKLMGPGRPQCVAMTDIDRGIDYVLHIVGTEILDRDYTMHRTLTHADRLVLAAYDYNRTVPLTHELYHELQALLPQLREAASKAREPKR